MNAMRFALGLIPAVIAIGAFNPVRENLRNYGRWLVQAQSPLVALALIPLLAKDALRAGGRLASARACLAAMLALTLASYLFYYPFNHWLYLRFLLPAFPVLFVLMAAGIRFLCRELPVPVRACAATVLCVAAALFGVMFAHDQFIFNQRRFEQRYVLAARYVDQLTPANAVIYSMQHSGSIRYYAHRITLRYDWLDKHELDATMRELEAKGYRPYIVLDDWEEAEFRKLFSETSRVGRLDWKPIVPVPGNPEVRIFDPEGRADEPLPASHD